MVDIMKKKIILSVCAAVAMAFSLPSQAQRLIPKQRGIEIVGSVPLIKGEKFLAADNFGMGASLTRYLGRENYTFVMAEYEQQNMPYRSYNVKLKDALLQVGYMHPVLSDRGKNVLLYGGISALGGYDFQSAIAGTATDTQAKGHRGCRRSSTYQGRKVSCC